MCAVFQDVGAPPAPAPRSWGRLTSGVTHLAAARIAAMRPSPTRAVRSDPCWTADHHPLTTAPTITATRPLDAAKCGRNALKRLSVVTFILAP